jgi:hypothetical protein
VNVADRVAIRAHYERFPATVKGAFVLRGADADPHQVAIREARLAEIGGRGARPIGLAPAVVDVAPHRDFFVPFEFPIVDLDAGWYRLECDVDIDGTPVVVQPGSAFSVSWPRGTTRRGSIPVATDVSPDRGPAVHVDHVELATDAVRVHFSSEEPVDVQVFADGDRLPIVAATFDDRAARGTLSTYPALRSHERLRLEFRPSGHPRGRAAEVEVELP